MIFWRRKYYTSGKLRLSVGNCGRSCYRIVSRHAPSKTTNAQRFVCTSRRSISYDGLDRAFHPNAELNATFQREPCHNSSPCDEMACQPSASVSQREFYTQLQSLTQHHMQDGRKGSARRIAIGRIAFRRIAIVRERIAGINAYMLQRGDCQR